MANVLDKIVADKRIELEQRKHSARLSHSLAMLCQTSETLKRR